MSIAYYERFLRAVGCLVYEWSKVHVRTGSESVGVSEARDATCMYVILRGQSRGS